MAARTVATSSFETRPSDAPQDEVELIPLYPIDILTESPRPFKDRRYPVVI
jgi:hypothetical protein